MVVLFLGAGASAPFGYPVMTGLTTKLLELPGPTGETLYHLSKLPRYFDAEIALQDIEAFKTLWDRKLSTTFSASLANIRPLPVNITITSRKGPVVMSIDDFYRRCLSLRDNIHSQIFDLYRFDYNLTPKLALYDQLFSLLPQLRREIIIYTTNYDRIIEASCEQRPAFDIRVGFEYNAKVQRHLWNTDSFDRESRSDATTIKLFKLHGSLDWKTGPYGIERSSHEVQLGPDRAKDLLIYPGSKDPPEDEPFRTLYERFENQLKMEEPCLVIGFSFRDYYLNHVFRDFIQRYNGQLFIMGKNCGENVTKNLLRGAYVEPKRISLIPSHFGENDWNIHLIEALKHGR